MKKLAISFLFILFSQTIFSQKLDLMKILSNISNEFQDRQLSYQTILNEEFKINSTSNAAFSGGKDKIQIKLNIPKECEKWVYRITILDIKSNFKFQENETLSWQLINNRRIDDLYNMKVPINVVFMDNSGDVMNFMNNKTYRRYNNYSVYNTNSFTAYSNLNTDNIYMGIENTSAMEGIKIILEIVALMPDQNLKPVVTFQAEKQIKEAKELFELGVINKKSFDSIVSLHTPKITRTEALQKLKEAKIKLDKGEITQLQYDELKNELSPIILNKQ
jgi:hypothetical protein